MRRRRLKGRCPVANERASGAWGRAVERGVATTATSSTPDATREPPNRPVMILKIGTFYIL